MLAMAFATLQLVSPALVVIADGTAIRGAVSESVAHVESASSESCPQIHNPDCALCRYLSGATGSTGDGGGALHLAESAPTYADTVVLAFGASIFLPHGRAPPLG